MSGVHDAKSAAEPDPSSSASSETRSADKSGGGGGGGGGLVGIAAVQRAFRFLDGPADVLSASTACRRWRELACAGSVWRDKAEREGIVDKAAAFEVEVPRAAEGGSALDVETASMAFYARVFVLKGYKMRDEDEDEAEDNPDRDGGIRTAVGAWLADPAAAKARYGPIASWDVSEVTDLSWLFHGATSFDGDLSRWNVSNVEDMSCMFHGATSFNGDLSRWDVSSVEDMISMFYGATSFDRQLDGAWSTSTADKTCMFYNSPGTIAGRTKAANGTIE